MKYTILSLLLIFLGTSLHAQYNERLQVESSFGGYYFMANDKRVKPRQVIQMMREIDSTAYTIMQRSSRNSTFAGIVSGAGGILIGWPIGTMIAGGEPNWTMAAIGGVLTVASIPISNRARRQAVEAVEKYNAKVARRTSPLQMNLAMTPAGFTFVVRM